MKANEFAQVIHELMNLFASDIDRIQRKHSDELSQARNAHLRELVEIRRALGVDPREIAILVSLRKGPRSLSAISVSIADTISENTKHLLIKMAGEDLVIGNALDEWSLTTEGYVVLEKMGL